MSSRAHAHGKLREDHVILQESFLAAKERIAKLETAGKAFKDFAEGKVAELEAAGKAVKDELVLAQGKASRLESELLASRERDTELVLTRERVTELETELAETRERVMLREAAVEAESAAAHERASQAEERAVMAERDLANGLADAFIDGFEELRGKISAAFPAIDISGFMPTGESDGEERGSDEAEGDAGAGTEGDEEEGREGS